MCYGCIRPVYCMYFILEKMALQLLMCAWFNVLGANRQSSAHAVSRISSERQFLINHHMHLDKTHVKFFFFCY